MAVPERLVVHASALDSVIPRSVHGITLEDRAQRERDGADCGDGHCDPCEALEAPLVEDPEVEKQERGLGEAAKQLVADLVKIEVLKRL